MLCEYVVCLGQEASLYLLLLSYSHYLHKQRLLLNIKHSRRSLITQRVLHLESYEAVDISHKKINIRTQPRTRQTLLE